jgi:TolB-like protein/DNA-binding winged helix-turn-helix (wHTH) protein
LFEGFRLDRRGLFRSDESAAPAPVEIGSRALDILGLLVQKPGDLITRDEIMAAAWPGTVVEDHNLTVQVSALRRVLDQDRAEGSCIQTVPGRGYRFVAPVTRAPSAISSAPGPFSRNSGDRPIAEDGQSRNPVAPGPSGNVNLNPTPPRARHRFGGVMAAVIGALGLVLAAAVGIRYSSWSGGLHPVPRLSIVVLPFTNLSDDPKQQYFADAITEDLTTELSRIADMLVISRDSAFTYKGKAVAAKEIGRELGVRYVLDGSVQRSGNQVRINAHLIDAETDTHLWADRFDRGIGDLLALQDEITGRIAVTLSAELISTEANWPVENPDALDYVFRGRFILGKSPSLENYRTGIGLFEQALAIDPQSAEAKTYLAGALVYEFRVFRRKSRMADLARAEKLIDEAFAASAAKISYAHNVKGGLLRLKGQWQDAINEFEAALALNRNIAGSRLVQAFHRGGG